MQKSEVKAIAFKGIERINERINCNDGACEEIINLRPEGNTWHNVGKRKKITDNGLNIHPDTKDYQIIIHPASQDKYYILWNKTTNKVALYDKNTENFINNFDVSGNIISVSYLDNVLIICTNDDKFCFLLKDSQYYLLPLRNCFVNLKTESVPNCKEYETNYFALSLGIKELQCKMFSFKSSFNQPYMLEEIYKEDISKALHSFFGFYEEKHKEDKTFKGMSLYRVAFKLYDGSYINYSNISFADTNGDDITNIYGSSIAACPVTISFYSNGTDTSSDQITTHNYCVEEILMYDIYGKHKITVDFLDNLQSIKELMNKNIITSIDVFMTRPLPQFDIDDYDNMDVYFTRDVNGHIFYNWGTTIFYAPKISFPVNKQLKDQITNGTYFKIKSYTKEDIEAITDGKITEEITATDIKTLEANAILPTPTSDNEVIFKNSYNYNQKQHLYNIIYNIFKGYQFPNDEYFEFYETAENLIKTDIINYDTIYYTIQGMYNNKSFFVKHKIDYPASLFIKETNDDEQTNFYLQLPRLFSYPSIDELTFGIYAEDSNGDSIKLYEKICNNFFNGGNTNFIANIIKDKETLPHRQHIKRLMASSNITRTAYANTSNDLKGSIFKQIKADISEDFEIAIFKEIPQIKSTNILQLSQTDNPFFLPNEENYVFGEQDNEILAISSSNGLTQDRNFGTYPLYIFATDGIYTMAVGNGNVAYSNIVKINNTQIINPNVLNTKYGIIFLSKEGLSLINGRSISVISHFVKGKPTITNAINLKKLESLAPKHYININSYTQDLHEILNKFALTPTTDDFLQEIKDAQFYYDELHNEVCIVVKDKYTYVFNLALNVFYKRTDYYKIENDKILTNTSTHSELGIILSKKINLYSFDEEFSENEDICKSISIITKPFLLDTRHLKHIERIIFDMSWRDKDDFYLVLFGSKDGVNYNVVKKCIKKANDKGKEHQDVYLELVLSAVKYCFLVICSRNFYDTRIANVTFQFKQTANYGGIR